MRRLFLLLSLITLAKSSLAVDDAALQQLSLERFYQTHSISNHTTVRAVVVQDIPAPASAVWDCLLDVSHYSDMIPYVWSSEVLNERRGKTVQDVTFRVWFSSPWHGNMTHHPTHSTVTFETAYTVAKWHVSSEADMTRVSLVVYSTLSPWMPRVIADLFIPVVMRKATKWLSHCSETRPQKQPRGLFGRKKPAPEPDIIVAPIKPGLQRYGLVSTVLVLAFYNVHLYLSQ